MTVLIIRYKVLILPNTNSRFEALLDELSESHNFNLTGYKRSSLMRRVSIRMHNLGISSERDYGDYVKENPEEFEQLFINFTSFFRDASAWDYVAESIIPRIIAGKSESEPIRAWSAACASGEETYTLAIVLAQALGVEQYEARVRIYGTDVDEHALNQARLGSYLSSKVVGMPGELLEKYFEPAAEGYVFRKDLRRSIIFCRHDMIQDAPMSKIDLLVCRNALMYFNTETQARVLVRFHFSLQDNGFLLLGNAEMVPTQTTNIFTPINLQHRIFTKLPKVNLNRQVLIKALSRMA